MSEFKKKERHYMLVKFVKNNMHQNGYFPCSYQQIEEVPPNVEPVLNINGQIHNHSHDLGQK